MLTIRTDRLDLVAATLDHLEAELRSPPELARLLGASVPAGWPPGEYDRQAIEFFRSRLAEDRGSAGWYGWYAILRSSECHGGTVVGAGGYFGPPAADGTVEIGYSIVPEFQCRGFATELVRALVRRVISTPGVTRVIAHTSPDNIGSVKVLERCGFSVAGPGRESGSLQYVLLRPTHIRKRGRKGRG
jgi:ribosomal-protein-alanine N-acetyltransferase